MQHILKKLNLEINFDKQPRSRSEYLLIIAKRLIKDSRIEDFLIIIELIEDECLKSELLSECMDKLDMMNNSDLYKIIDLIVDKYYKSNALIILINKVIKFDNKQFDLKLLFKKLIN